MFTNLLKRLLNAVNVGNSLFGLFKGILKLVSRYPNKAFQVQEN